MSKALVLNVTHKLFRRNKDTGAKETVTFLGTLRLKPKGWRVVPNSRDIAMVESR